MPPPPKPPQSAAAVLDRLLARVPRGTQAWVIGALGVGAALFLARWLGARQPLRSWLSLQLAAIWLWQAVLAAACASVGVRLATRALPADEWTPLERLAVALLDEANVVFFGRDALPDGPTTDRLNRNFRQIRAYAAFRLYLRK